MNIAIIFAGGKGTRMEDTDTPKQFLNVSGVPIIVRTVQAFQKSKHIDKIIIVTLKDWIDYTCNLVNKYELSKVENIVEGGTTGQMSIFAGIKEAISKYERNSVVLINDGVRPFIDEQLIEDNIKLVKEKGSAVSMVYATETISIVDEYKNVYNIPDRNKCIFLKAPQSFILGEIYDCHIKAQQDGLTKFIDSASLMKHYGKVICTVETNYDNIKITSRKDIAIAESICERKKIK